MSSEEFNRLFISEYNKADFEEICYKLIDGRDVNENFRLEIYQTALKILTICSNDFIVDLYLEMAIMAKRNFAIISDFNQLANEVLCRGVDYLEIYEKGARQSFDTIIASGILDLTKEQLEEIVTYLNENDAENDFMLQRFQSLLDEKIW